MTIPLRNTPAPLLPETPFPAFNTALLQDLIDALWLEQLYGFREHCKLSPGNGAADTPHVLAIQLDGRRCLQFSGRKLDGMRPFRVAQEAPTLLTQDGQTRRLTAEDAVAHLQDAAWWRDKSGRFRHFFLLSQQQAGAMASTETAIVEALRQDDGELLHWERLSCLKDRPFHPLSRAKDWEGDDDVGRYLPNAMRPFSLSWIAVRRQLVRGASQADNGDQPLADALLDRASREQLNRAAQAMQLDDDSWLWMPVHPWQWHWLHIRRAEIAGQCILLGSFGEISPTASLRSLVISGCSDAHLKLSLSVNTLGAIRTMPPRYLLNAVCASALLEKLRQDDPWLARHMLLCDETRWWAVSTNASTEEHAGLIRDPGELACLIRRYPTSPGRVLIPMSALPVCLEDGSLPAFDYLAANIASGTGDDRSETDWRLFGAIAAMVVGIGLRCIAKGVMPEMHGQNLLLACNGAQIEAIVLRDHDTLRICPPSLRKNGLAVPAYLIDRNTPNTLELERLVDLLAYFQTLAVEVNLYAVLAALALRHGVPESHGWRIVRREITSLLEELAIATDDAALIHRNLLEEERWPFKQVIAPLLERENFGTGMPSKMGSIANPLLAVGG